MALQMLDDAIKAMVTDAGGNSLNILINKKLSNGNYTVEWNAQNVLHRIYYCRLLCDKSIQTKKMIIVR